MEPRTFTNTTASQDPYNEKRLGYRPYPYKSASSHPECDDTCDICVNHYLSFLQQTVRKYKEALSDAEAKDAVHNFLESTDRNLEAVRSSVGLYGDAIIRRWKNKSSAKRETVLLKAKPNISKLKGLMVDLHDQLARHPKLLLSKDLHDNHPAAWAAYDSEQLNFQFFTGLIQLSYNPHGVSLKNHSFGTLVPYNRSAMHCGEIEGFPRAFAVLQAQNSLSKFLRATVESILIPEPTEGDPEWQRLAAINFQVSSNNVTPFYDVPPELSITAIAQICNTRYDAARKELDKLQIDPYHLRDILATMWTSEVSRKGLTERQQQMLLVELVVIHLSAVESWCILRLEAAQVQHTCANGLVSGVAPSADIDLAIRRLQRLLMNYNHKVSLSMRLSAGLLASGTSNKGDFRQAPVIWSANMLSKIAAQDVNHGALNSTQLLKFLGDHLPTHVPSNGFGRCVRQLFNDARALDQALSTIRLHRPCIKRSSSGEIELNLSQHERNQYRTEILVMQGHGPSFPHSELARPLQRLLELPSPHKVTKNSLENFDAAHQAMSGFWEAVKNTRIELYRSHKINPIVLAVFACCPASEQYQEILTTTREVLEGKVRKLEDRTRAEKPFAEPTSSLQPLQTTWGPVLAETVSPATPKEKPKTRPVDVEVPQIENLQIEPPEEQPAEQRFIELRSRHSLDLLQRIYTPGACVKATASERWEDWLAAMRDAGCEVVDSPGSAVKFVLKGWGTESIGIHKPHGRQTTIDPIKLANYGNRLQERFGWCYDTFKLRGEA
ncbi:hypothetical protein LTR56_026126 [Elasticomyces elasticus]|nr:hypothetical protein LTR56_026126 [Elasticomyces elasticus]KAK3618801.1 hypothetical protein LTR22_026232 [Elasticomyces elasticus]KAK4903749.1 hypothetical protein LTR49_026674 [Elasticomyces elasticus]KAK5737965.1 hypothetical protein LTS12_025743 [Elasticomyces elasticus]